MNENLDYLNTISAEIIDACIEVHKELGPGLLESVYEHCLFIELQNRGIKVKQQVYLPVIYKEQEIDINFRMDLLVEDKVVIELKAVETILPIHKAQILTYLKLADKKLGLLINFNVPLLKQGINRFVN